MSNLWGLYGKVFIGFYVRTGQWGMVNPNIDKLLEQKRKKFFEVVYRACKSRNLPIPHINFEDCESEDENQLAHYHPDLNQICVSKRQLIKQNYEDIEKTARHEVTHEIEPNHESRFGKEEEITNIASWNPPPGVAIGGGNDKTTSEKDGDKEKEPEIDRTYCNYHVCGKKAKLTKCKHCGKYFCKNHIQPCLPGGYSPEGDRYVVLENQLETEDTKNTHPCPDYVDYLKKKEEDAKKRWGDTLKKLLGSKRKEETYEPTVIQVDEEEEEKKVPHYHREYIAPRKYEEEYEEKPKEHEKKKSFWDKIKSIFKK